MRKFFKQYNQVEKKYFSINKVFLTVCFLLALIQRIGYSEEMIESSKYIGTWIHRYDGSDSEAFAYNNKYAENILVLYEDGTFTYNWVDRYDSYNYKVTSKGLAYYVTSWGEGEGDWIIANGKITLEYTDRNPKVYTIKMDEKGRKLKMGNWTFRKRLH